MEEFHGFPVFDNANHGITAKVVFSNEVSSLEPTITVSEGASICRTRPQDFTNPVVYSVTAEDGVTMQNWTVTIVEMEKALGLDPNSDIQVYPNPTSSNIFIKEVGGDFVISISDLSGKTLFVKENATELPLVDLEPGTYLLNISVNGDSPKSVRIIKGN